MRSNATKKTATPNVLCMENSQAFWASCSLVSNGARFARTPRGMIIKINPAVSQWNILVSDENLSTCGIAVNLKAKNLAYCKNVTVKPTRLRNVVCVMSCGPFACTRASVRLLRRKQAMKE